MATVGIFLSSEERGPRELVEGAQRAEQAGFSTAWVSDHYHPWTHAQGESPFVWTALGAIAQATSTLKMWTAVTCPTLRIHPAVIAQAVATTSVLSDGRFGFGVGTGEALNEHILGDAWPSADVRLEMLEEAVGLIRELWTGETVDHRGTHYTVENAHLFSVPAQAPPVHVSGFGPKAVSLAARIGDGFMCVGPEKELVARYRAEGGKGTTHGGIKACYGPDADAALSLAHRLWPTEALPGELAQVLPTYTHFEQASQLVTPEMVAGSVATGPDPKGHIENLQAMVDAGYDEVYVGQIGPDQEGFLDFYAKEVLPHVG